MQIVIDLRINGKILQNAEMWKRIKAMWKVKVYKEITWGHFSWWEGHTDLSVRTSEHDKNGCCASQQLPLDQEGQDLVDKLNKWIAKNLQYQDKN